MARGMELKTSTEAAASKAVATSRARNNNEPKYTHCQKLGHEKNQCFEMIGYPPNWLS